MLTPDEQQIFQALGRNPAFRGWLAKQEIEQDKVLKSALATELIFRAQGAAGILDRIKSHLGQQ